MISTLYDLQHFMISVELIQWTNFIFFNQFSLTPICCHYSTSIPFLPSYNAQIITDSQCCFQKFFTSVNYFVRHNSWFVMYLFLLGYWCMTQGILLTYRRNKHHGQLAASAKIGITLKRLEPAAFTGRRLAPVGSSVWGSNRVLMLPQSFLGILFQFLC